MSLKFEWDRRKADQNHDKHQVTFEEAITVFRDTMAYIFDDDEHSEDERREIIIGYSARNRILLVIFTERDDNVRIISARKAELPERRNYENARSH